MNIPELKRSNRKREFDLYNQKQIDEIVYGYLFDAVSHRNLDQGILELDSLESLGYQSMGILHYLGITKEFKGLFNDNQLEDTIELLSNINDNDYLEIIESLIRTLMRKMEHFNDTLNENKVSYEVQIQDDGDEVFLEGNEKVYLVNKYERNPRLREYAIKMHGTKCIICGFDFGKVYGELGEGYIEIHHLIPLNSIKTEIEVNPRTDLIPVCSNCHRMLHRKCKDNIRMDELKKMFQL